MKVKEIILSMDFSMTDTPVSNFKNCNSDVIIIVENDNDGNKLEEKYAATFFTYKNLKMIIRQNRKNGEFLKGKYFWAKKLVLIDTMEISQIEKVVKDVINQGDFQSVFRRL